MALKIELKPEERLFIGEHILINGNDRRMKLVIETKSRMLRESEMISEDEADTLCGQLQFAMQRLYLANDPAPLLPAVEQLIVTIAEREPKFQSVMDVISEHIAGERYYPALKLAKGLREREEAMQAMISASKA
jgi:flagellar protein FlbT